MERRPNPTEVDARRRRLDRRLVVGRARAAVRDRLDDILVVGAAYQVISYDGIVRGLEPATRYTLTGGGDHFLQRIAPSPKPAETVS